MIFQTLEAKLDSLVLLVLVGEWEPLAVALQVLDVMLLT